MTTAMNETEKEGGISYERGNLLVDDKLTSKNEQKCLIAQFN